MITQGLRKILIVCVYVGAAAASGLYSVLRPAGRPRTALYSGCTVQRPGAGFVSFRDTEAESDSERMGLGSADKGEAAVQTVQACTVQYKDLHYHLSCQTD